MLDEKFLEKVNKVLETRTFSVQSNLLRAGEELTVDFRVKIVGVKKLFHVGIENEYVSIEIFLPFEDNGNGTKDRLFTILSMNQTMDLTTLSLLNPLKYRIENYIEDVLSWFGIKNKTITKNIYLTKV